MSGDLPPGWGRARLADVAEVVAGQSPPSSTYNTDGEGLPFFQGKAEFGDLSPTTVKWSTAPKRIAEMGDVLISVRAPVGPANLADQTCAIGRGLAAIRPGDEIPSRYLLDYLRYSVSSLKEVGTGTTFDAISGGQLRDHSVMVPPLGEQHRIVESIESYLMRLDAAEAALARVQANLERYRVSVLKAAVEGRLVPTEAELAREEGREYEPAEVLLDRILLERRARWEEAELAKLEAKGKPPKGDAWKQKYKAPVAPDLDGLPELPEGWCWTTLDQVSWHTSYGTSVKCVASGTGEPVVRIPDVRNGSPRSSGLNRAVKPLELESDAYLSGGDFLVVRTNGSRNLIARAALVPDSFVAGVYFASYLVRFRLVGADGPWLKTYWESPDTRVRLEHLAATSAGQYNISQTAMRQVPVPLPPASELERIQSEVDRALSIVDETAADIGQELARLPRLRQSVLATAFEGKLVDQDPDDEPASVLLERIAAERERRESETKVAKRSARERKVMV
jgi:type I restriction enzyme, S subunit